MKIALLSILILACTFATAALIAKPKVFKHSTSAQAMCMPGDSARACWHHLEHRSY
ncbi:MAG: hypothetical protein ACRC6G_00450 [Deefgea sp.]